MPSNCQSSVNICSLDTGSFAGSTSEENLGTPRWIHLVVLSNKADEDRTLRVNIFLNHLISIYESKVKIIGKQIERNSFWDLFIVNFLCIEWDFVEQTKIYNVFHQNGLSQNIQLF
jgi:hypothetical protein